MAFTLEGLKTTDDVNQATTALMMLDGVDSVEIGLSFAHVDGQTSLEQVNRALSPLGFKARKG
nr:hypothetical protein [Larsenimonas rhizosphaerae]